MSMITEFVKELREKSALFSRSDFAVAGIAKDYKEAADIIEELSAKLASANMDRSEQYYKDVPDINVGKNFSEKLIEQISKKKKYHKDFYEKMGCTEHDKDLHKATQLAFDECMEIVGELSKEYKSNGWIPVSEKLPDENKYSDYYKSVIVTLDNGRVVDGCYRNMDKEWWVDAVDGEHYSVNATGHVIAWQSLPQPYKGE